MSDSYRPPWLASFLIAATAFLGIMGLEVMIELGNWLRTPFFLLLITVAAVVTTRLLTRQRSLPSLIGAVVAIIAMVPVFAVSDEGESHLFPSPAALGDLGGAIRSGIEHAATTVAPAPAAPGFTALITLGLVVLFLVADYLAVARGAAAFAGLLLLGPWMPAVFLQHRVSTLALIAAIGLWLVVLALSRRQADPQRRPAYGGALVATVAALAGVTLVAPMALGGVGWGMIPRIDTPSGVDGATRLNLAVDLRTSLTTNSVSPVVVYDTSGARPSALKLYTLTDFDGVQWEREDTEAATIPLGRDVLWPTPVDGWTERERTRLEMQVLNLQETNLPLPPTPRSVDIDGSWDYDIERDEVVSNTGTVADVRYSVETDPSLPAREDLEETPADPVPGDAELDPRYLAVAPAIDLARVESLARDITGTETTRLGQVTALQSYLRNTSEFAYDTSVDPSGSDAVSTFLDDRRGYCIHFATTMVIMARTLDIPARMGHGFLGGTATDAGTYVVQGGDAHVWPEIWFPEQGWVRFEPTPAVQTGAPPSYADPLVAQTDGVDSQVPEVPEMTPVDPQEPDVPDTTGRGTPGADTGGDASIPLWGWAAVAVLMIGVGLGGWLWRSRRTFGRGRLTGPEVEWESLRTRLPESLRWGTELTPQEAGEYVRTRLEGHLAEPTGDVLSTEQSPLREAVLAIDALASAVADHRYAPSGSATDQEQLRVWADQVLAGAKITQQART